MVVVSVCTSIPKVETDLGAIIFPILIVTDNVVYADTLISITLLVIAILSNVTPDTVQVAPDITNAPGNDTTIIVEGVLKLVITKDRVVG